jgi:hypothetical protein
VLPELARDRQRIDLDPLPPCGLVAMPVQLAVMDTAHWDGELVADLATERAGLGASASTSMARSISIPVKPE